MVLVVDDNEAVRRAMVRWLQHEGFEVAAAASGPEALDRVTSDPPPDVVLLDIAMPGMDGLAVLEQLRSRPETRRLPVIMLTALQNDQAVDRARHLGVSGYLVKSRFDWDAIRDHILRSVEPGGR